MSQQSCTTQGTIQGLPANSKEDFFNMQKSSNHEFYNFVGTGSVGDELFNGFDLYYQERLAYVKDEVEARRGVHKALNDKEQAVGENYDFEKKVSTNFVSQAAMMRYFSMMEMGRHQLSGIFTEDDFLALLNDKPQPIWDYTPGKHLIDEDLPITLGKKIRSLNTIQRTALVDLCEIIWRTSNYESIEDLVGLLGVKLMNA